MTAQPQFKDLPGLKESDLEKISHCAVCGELALEGLQPTFYRVTLERCMFNLEAIQQRVGLQMMMGGSGPLARAMGPDRDLAKVFAGPVTVFVHEQCADDFGHLLTLMPEPKDPEDSE